ncbi:carbamoyltransferase N-terminal domain-containing protein [Photorhabdus asymbiotica]|uniref:carbamoyltransferase N-terminal domain-containing protein n=1 Tax=Photorhabdus asymbiotica TaxID=291112 RepID=UPI003DA71DE2
MNKPIYVLGSGLSHDGSACLMKNGKIIVGIEKERLTKIKHDGFNDNDAIRYCLNAAGITFKDVDLFVEKYTVNEKHKPDDVIKRRGRIIPEYLPIVRIGHHIAHAYSAVGTSPFSESAVIVCDGMGGSIDSCLDHDIRLVPSDIAKLSKSDYIDYFEKESYYKFFNNNVIPVFKDYSRFNFNDLNRYKIAPYDIEHSIGGLYGGASKFVFGNDFNEGKLMGLAPYGKSGRFSGELFLMKDARVKINYDLIENLGLKDTNIKDNFQYCADLAKWVQEQTEEALFYLLNEYYEMYSSDNLCYAGGLALNAVANGKITQNTPFKNVYIQPAAGDNGLAIGACYYGWMKVLNKEKVPFNGNPYFGIKYDTSESSLCKYLDDNYVITKPGNLEEVVAKHISEGKVVGCFRKGSEFGPRALGNRSILADLLYLLNGFILSFYPELSQRSIDFIHDAYIIVLVTIVIKSLSTINIVGALRSGGDNRFIIIIDMVAAWFFGIPVCYIVLFYTDLPLFLAFAAPMVEDMVKAVLSTFRVIGEKWQRTINVS